MTRRSCCPPAPVCSRQLPYPPGGPGWREAVKVTPGPRPRLLRPAGRVSPGACCGPGFGPGAAVADGGRLGRSRSRTRWLGLRAAAPARSRARSGSMGPRPGISPGRSARPSRVASGMVRLIQAATARATISAFSRCHEPSRNAALVPGSLTSRSCARPSLVSRGPPGPHSSFPELVPHRRHPAAPPSVWPGAGRRRCARPTRRLAGRAVCRSGPRRAQHPQDLIIGAPPRSHPPPPPHPRMRPAPGGRAWCPSASRRRTGRPGPGTRPGRLRRVLTCRHFRGDLLQVVVLWRRRVVRVRIPFLQPPRLAVVGDGVRQLPVLFGHRVRAGHHRLPGHRLVSTGSGTPAAGSSSRPRSAGAGSGCMHHRPFG